MKKLISILLLAISLVSYSQIIVKTTANNIVFESKSNIQGTIYREIYAWNRDLATHTYVFYIKEYVKNSAGITLKSYTETRSYTDSELQTLADAISGLNLSSTNNEVLAFDTMLHDLLLNDTVNGNYYGTNTWVKL